MICGKIEKAEQLERMRKIEDHWNKNKALVDQFGPYKTNNPIAKAIKRAYMGEI